jgi:hypothetical protein
LYGFTAIFPLQGADVIHLEILSEQPVAVRDMRRILRSLLPSPVVLAPSLEEAAPKALRKENTIKNSTFSRLFPTG